MPYETKSFIWPAALCNYTERDGPAPMRPARGLAISWMIAPPDKGPGSTALGCQIEPGL